MAKVAFISLYDRNANGLRIMSAILRRGGHECHIIFLKRYNTNTTYKLDLEVGEYPWQGISKRGRVFKYASNSRIDDSELKLLKEVLQEINPDVIGLTVNTPLRVQAVKVTRYLKQHFIQPVIWGGYDPTVNAQDCLDLCDYSCIGEGDETILGIAERIDQGLPFDNVGNIAYKRDGELVFNPRHALEHDLDRYPWRDNDPEFKYFIDDDRLERNCAVLNDSPVGTYKTMSSRGCLYKCSYCCEATFKGLYRGEVFLRRRSPKDLIAELTAARQRFGISLVMMEDEIFAMDLKWLQEFVPLYREQVGLPLIAFIYPIRGVEKILELLKSAGLNKCCLALESGSERINKEIFQRVYNRQLFLHTAQVCRKLGMDFYTDVITYNPYETEDDLKQTLDVLLNIEGRYDMCINKLFVLPGTKLYEKMRADGLRIEESERDHLFNYYSRLFWIASFGHRSKSFIRFIQKGNFFKSRPSLLNPAVMELLIDPIWGAKSVVKNMFPNILQAVRLYRHRARLRKREPHPANQCR